MNSPKERTVYVLEVKEVISKSYYVVANSKSEAIRNYYNATSLDFEYEFNRVDSESKVCEVDGSHQYHKTFKPTVDYKIKQELISPDWADDNHKYWEFKYERGEENDN